MTNYENTYLRDMELSQKFRTVGYCSDIDNLFCDFQNYKPAGLSEYKHYKVTDIQGFLGRPSNSVIRRLADSAEVPYSYVIYLPGEHGAPWQYNLIPVNSFAKKVLGEKPVVMSERDFHGYHNRIRHLSEKKAFPELTDWIHPELKHLINDKTN